MFLDDIEIIPVYDDNGRISGLDIRCDRPLSYTKYSGPLNKKAKKHFTCVPYTNPKDNLELLGAKFKCDPGYRFNILFGPKMDTVTLYTELREEH